MDQSVPISKMMKKTIFGENLLFQLYVKINIAQISAMVSVEHLQNFLMVTVFYCISLHSFSSLLQVCLIILSFSCWIAIMLFCWMLWITRSVVFNRSWTAPRTKWLYWMKSFQLASSLETTMSTSPCDLTPIDFFSL